MQKEIWVVELLGWKQKGRRMNRKERGCACYFVPAVIIATVGSWRRKIKRRFGVVVLPRRRDMRGVHSVFIC